MTAVRLNKRVDFQIKGDGQWINVTTKPIWAAIVYRKGSETVIAGRKAGVNTVSVYVRPNSDINAVDPTWRLKDAKGTIFNIKSVIPSDGGSLIELTVESGVPT